MKPELWADCYESGVRFCVKILGNSMKCQLGVWQLPRSWLQGQELLGKEWKTEGSILWPHKSMCCLDLCTAIILPAWRAAMEAVQGLLKGSSWTQNGVSAAQLSGNMYLSVWKGAETEEKSSVVFWMMKRRGAENWDTFSECLGECRGSSLGCAHPVRARREQRSENLSCAYGKWSSADIPCGQST